MTAVSLHMKAPAYELPAPVDDAKAGDGWRAGLKLSYAFNKGQSWLLQQDRRGPLFVQKPFYPEGPRTCHTYIVHPPGGVVGGDSLDLEVILKTDSQVLLTTPAASKFYRSAGADATQINRLVVGPDAVLEWLPQETIIYNGARARMRTVVRMEPGARFVGWEMICLGLPACSQPFIHGWIDQRFEIWREEQPLFIDPLRIGPQDPLLKARWGMAGHPVVGILAATVNESGAVGAIRRKVAPEQDDGLFAVTRIHGLTLCRYLGDDVYAGLKMFRRAWEVLRPLVKGSDVCVPRIWAT